MSVNSSCCRKRKQSLAVKSSTKNPENEVKLSTDRDTSEITTGGSPATSILGTSTTSRRIQTRKEKEDLEVEILIAESIAWAYYVMAYYHTEDKMKQIKETEQVIEKEKKQFNDRITKIKAVQFLAERQIKELEIAQILKDIPGSVQSEQFERSKIIRDDIQKIKFPLVMKNFNMVAPSDTEKIVNILKDTHNAMSKTKELIDRKEKDTENNLSDFVEKIDLLDESIQKYELKEGDLNDSLAKCLSLKIGLESIQSIQSEKVRNEVLIKNTTINVGTIKIK